MKFKSLHPWPADYAEAVALQARLRRKIVIRPLPHVRLVAGADVSYDRGDDMMHAGVVVMRLPELEIVQTQAASLPVDFPYIPGLLTFREAPALLEVFRKLECRPDAVIFDGQGIAHMRGIGLASHVGLWLGLPSVGCAKSRLVGEHRDVAPARGRRAALRHEKQVVGSVLRTRGGAKPVYVSPGHLSDVASSVRLILRCCTKCRLPETTRAAHALVNEVRHSFV
ncbi:MAG: endonuclease V [Planctomycetota bacterium]